MNRLQMKDVSARKDACTSAASQTLLLVEMFWQVQYQIFHAECAETMPILKCFVFFTNYYKSVRNKTSVQQYYNKVTLYSCNRATQILRVFFFYLLTIASL